MFFNLLHDAFSQNEINECLKQYFQQDELQTEKGLDFDCVIYVEVRDTNNLNDEIRNCKNIEKLIFVNSDIGELPSWIEELPKLKVIDFENVSLLPENLVDFRRVNSIGLIRCKGDILNLNETISNVYYENVRVVESTELKIERIKTRYLTLRNIHPEWNSNIRVEVEGCNSLTLFECDLGVIEFCDFPDQVQEMNLISCENVIIDGRFYKKFREIWELSIINPAPLNLY